MVHLRNTPSNFDELEEGEIREDGEIDFLIKLEETCQERLKKLLSMQALELKKFKILKKAREMEFEMNCKLNFPNYEILEKGFERHMKTQYRNFIAMQIVARNKEKLLKENWVEMAKTGKFDTAFFETPIPDSKFRMEKFDYESEMRVFLAKNGTSPNESNPTNPNFRSQNLDKSNPKTNLRGQILDESNRNPNLESEEVHGNKDEMECDATTLDGTNPNPIPKPSLSPNPNSLVSVMPNPNLKSEEACKEDEMVPGDDTTLNVSNPNSPPITTQNPNLESEVISTPDISNVSQTNPPITPNQVVAQSANMVLDNTINATPSSNQNTPPVQEPAAPSSSNQNAPPVQEFPAGDIDIAHELLRMMPPRLLHENPLQNELVMLHKLCEVIHQKHQQKVARLEAERNKEMEQVEKTYRQVDAELDTECSKGKLALKRRYETLVRNDRLAQEFHDIYHNAPLPVPSSRAAAPMAARRPTTPNPVASSNLAVQTPVSQNLDSDSRFSANRSVSGRGMLRAPAPHMMCAVQTRTTKWFYK